MVAGRLAAGMLLGDQRVKHAVHLFQHVHVGDGALQYDDARAIHQRLAPFGLQRAQRRCTGGQRTHLVAVVREDIRVHGRGVATVDRVMQALDELARQSVQVGLSGRKFMLGVLLKAPDLPAVAEAVNRLASAGIPMVTLVTDLPSSARRS